MVSLKENLAKYTKQSPPRMGEILHELVALHSARIFSDDEELRDKMRNLGVAEADILKVCLITKVTGFQDLIQPDKKLLQTDLDRFAHNAVKETDLNRAAVLRLMTEIVGATGKAVLCGSQKQMEQAVLEERAFMLPATLYEKELKDFQEAFELCRRRGNLTGLDLQRMEPLVAAGLPRAKYYVGYCLLHGAEEGHQQGAALLMEAAKAGDVEAAAELGDYYFKRGPSGWANAYSCYTSFGALALTPQRKRAVLSILNQKRFNHRFLWLSSILFLLFIATVFFAPGQMLYPPHCVWGSVCAVGSLAVLLLAARRLRRSPFDSFYFVPAAMFVLWSIYIAMRLLPV